MYVCVCVFMFVWYDMIPRPMRTNPHLLQEWTRPVGSHRAVLDDPSRQSNYSHPSRSTIYIYFILYHIVSLILLIFFPFYMVRIKRKEYYLNNVFTTIQKLENKFCIAYGIDIFFFHL